MIKSLLKEGSSIFESGSASPNYLNAPKIFFEQLNSTCREISFKNETPNHGSGDCQKLDLQMTDLLKAWLLFAYSKQRGSDQPSDTPSEFVDFLSARECPLLSVSCCSNQKILSEEGSQEKVEANENIENQSVQKGILQSAHSSRSFATNYNNLSIFNPGNSQRQKQPSLMTINSPTLVNSNKLSYSKYASSVTPDPKENIPSEEMGLSDFESSAKKYNLRAPEMVKHEIKKRNSLLLTRVNKFEPASIPEENHRQNKKDENKICMFSMIKRNSMLNANQLAPPIKEIIQNLEEIGSNLGAEYEGNGNSDLEFQLSAESVLDAVDHFVLKITLLKVEKESFNKYLAKNGMRKLYSSFGKTMNQGNLLFTEGKKEMNYYFKHSLGYDWKQLELKEEQEELFKKFSLEKLSTMPFILFSSAKGLHKEKLYHRDNKAYFINGNANEKLAESNNEKAKAKKLNIHLFTSTKEDSNKFYKFKFSETTRLDQQQQKNNFSNYNTEMPCVRINHAVSLRKGNVFTHCFTEKEDNLLGPELISFRTHSDKKVSIKAARAASLNQIPFIKLKESNPLLLDKGRLIMLNEQGGFYVKSVLNGEKYQKFSECEEDCKFEPIFTSSEGTGLKTSNNHELFFFDELNQFDIMCLNEREDVSMLHYSSIASFFANALGYNLDEIMEREKLYNLKGEIESIKNPKIKKFMISQKRKELANLVKNCGCPAIKLVFVKFVESLGIFQEYKTAIIVYNNCDYNQIQSLNFMNESNNLNEGSKELISDMEKYYSDKYSDKNYFDFGSKAHSPQRKLISHLLDHIDIGLDLRIGYDVYNEVWYFENFSFSQNVASTSSNDIICYEKYNLPVNGKKFASIPKDDSFDSSFIHPGLNTLLKGESPICEPKHFTRADFEPKDKYHGAEKGPFISLPKFSPILDEIPSSEWIQIGDGSHLKFGTTNLIINFADIGVL